MEGLNGCSIEDAKVALAKCTVQKREKKILDVKPDTDMTFQELADWYLGLESVMGKLTGHLSKVAPSVAQAWVEKVFSKKRQVNPRQMVI